MCRKQTQDFALSLRRGKFKAGRNLFRLMRPGQSGGGGRRPCTRKAGTTSCPPKTRPCRVGFKGTISLSRGEGGPGKKEVRGRACHQQRTLGGILQKSVKSEKGGRSHLKWEVRSRKGEKTSFKKISNEPYALEGIVKGESNTKSPIQDRGKNLEEGKASDVDPVLNDPPYRGEAGCPSRMKKA